MDAQYLFNAMGLIVVTIFLVFKQIKWLNRKAIESLAGKVALITGSGNGLGRQLCLAFARENCHIICVDIDDEGNQETVEQIRKISSTINVLSFHVDISDSEKVYELREKIFEQLNTHVDILVNNAGILYSGVITKMTDEQIKKLINVNVISHFWTLKAFLPDMIKNDSGLVVAIASISSNLPAHKLSLYASSKSAITGLMKSINFELLAMESNVKTLTVLPGVIATTLTPVKLYQKPGLIWDRNIPLVVLDPKDLANEIIEAIKKGKTELITPYYNYLLLKLLYLTYPYVHKWISPIKIQKK